MRRVLILSFVLLTSSCGGVDLSTQNLLHPEILMLRTEPPAVVLPAEITAEVRVYDPERKVRNVLWYLPLRADLYDLERFGRLTDLLRNPERASSLGFLYLGSGFSVTITLPSLPPPPLDPSLSLDTLPIPLLVILDRGEGEPLLKGIKRLRWVIPELVERTLAETLGRPPTPEERERAIRIRLNRNPEITGVNLFEMTGEGPYPARAREDLKVRRELQGVPLTLPVLSPGKGVRIVPEMVDPDSELGIGRGEPGFNYLTTIYLSPEGEFFAVTITSSDWLPLKYRGQSPFSRPEITDLPPGIKTIYLTLLDHQGGVTGTAFDLLFGDPSPPPFPSGTTLAYLVENRNRLLWVYTATPLPGKPGEAITLPVVLFPSPSLPLGVTAVVTPEPPEITLEDLDLLERDPLSAIRFIGVPVAVPGRWVRSFPLPLGYAKSSDLQDFVTRSP
jgi:hypothetical protein